MSSKRTYASTYRQILSLRQDKTLKKLLRPRDKYGFEISLKVM